MFGCFESIAGRLLFGRVWARLRCVMCPRAGGCFFFLGVADLSPVPML